MIMKCAPFLPFRDTDGLAKHLAAVAGVPTVIHGLSQLAGSDILFESTRKKAAFFQTDPLDHGLGV
jgi:hypothetical protein